MFVVHILSQFIFHKHKTNLLQKLTCPIFLQNAFTPSNPSPAFAFRMFPYHQPQSVVSLGQQQSSVDFASGATMDPALMAAQMHAARAQNELDVLAKKVRADRIALEQPWKDPRFFPITPENVMFYFCQRENPFFDPNSDNAMILMQNQGIGQTQLEAVLKAMTGIQFVLDEQCSPPLFIIRKQQRNGPDKSHYTSLPLYVLDGTVYQAPDMHTLLHSRLIGVMDPLRCAFQEAVSMLRFTPARGHFWEFRTRPAPRALSTAATGTDDMETDEGEFDEKFDVEMAERGHKRTTSSRGGGRDPLATRATPYQSQRTHALLAALAERFRDGDGSGGRGEGVAFGGGEATKMQKADSPPMSTELHQQAPSATSFSTALISDFKGLLFSSASFQRQHAFPWRDSGRPNWCCCKWR